MYTFKDFQESFQQGFAAGMEYQRPYCGATPKPGAAETACRRAFDSVPLPGDGPSGFDVAHDRSTLDFSEGER